MAIGFVAARFIQRRRGHSPVDRLAYISRARMRAQRTGTVHDYSDRSDLIGGPRTLLPAGALSSCADAEQLWNLVDAARHKYAILGLDLIVALPPAHELDASTTVELLEDFLLETIVSHDLAATYAIHAPHGGLNDDEFARDAFLEVEDIFDEGMRQGLLNRHAHVIVTPRRLDAGGFGRRYTALEPLVRRGEVVDALSWRRLWATFQNRFFASRGLELRVRPNAPLSGAPRPLAEVRRQRAVQLAGDVRHGRDLIVHTELEAANQALIQSGQAFGTLLRPFTLFELRSLLDRYVAHELGAEIIEAAVGLGDIVAIDGPHPVSWYVAADLVAAELAALGRAAVLATRETIGPGPAPILSGLSRAAADICSEVLAGPDLVIIEANGSPNTILEDMARAAEARGLVPVSIAHGGGSAHPVARIMPISSVSGQMVSGATIFVDQADALTAVDLDLILQATLAGQSKLVLVRRSQTIWPRWALLDMIAKAALEISWNPGPGLEQVRSSQRASRTTAEAPSALSALSTETGREVADFALPTTGIACRLVGRPQSSGQEMEPGCPQFGIDALGQIVTGRLIGVAAAFWASTPTSDLSWAPTFSLSDREVWDELSQLYPAWSGMDDNDGYDAWRSDEPEWDSAVPSWDDQSEPEREPKPPAADDIAPEEVIDSWDDDADPTFATAGDDI